MAPIKSNHPLAAYFDFFSKSGLDAVGAPPPPPAGMTATGGIISDYEDSGTYYRAHVFTSSGTFKVDDLGNIGATVEYVVVAGGGGGGRAGNGAAGAGGSGIVIIRYAGAAKNSQGDSVHTSGGYTYHVYSSTGSATYTD